MNIAVFTLGKLVLACACMLSVGYLWGQADAEAKQLEKEIEKEQS